MDIAEIKKNYGITDNDFADIDAYLKQSTLEDKSLDQDFEKKRWFVEPTYPLPSNFREIEKSSAALGFDISSDMRTGQLLATLAASKPNGKFLEIGTGCGLGTSWILRGMCSQSRLTSIETNSTWLEVARNNVHDARVTFLLDDAAQHIRNSPPETYDFIFADALPGKYFLVDEALKLLKHGGFYIIDDCIHQPQWPKEVYRFHRKIIGLLQERKDIILIGLEWAVGVTIAVKL